jgi:hypothetical protein
VRHLTKPGAPPPWEGITWILDLLPHWPAEALASIGAYQLAHAQDLPDGRHSSLGDAMAVIRARWVRNNSTAGSLKSVLSLGPREPSPLGRRPCRPTAQRDRRLPRTVPDSTVTNLTNRNT